MYVLYVRGTWQALQQNHMQRLCQRRRMLLGSLQRLGLLRLEPGTRWRYCQRTKQPLGPSHVKIIKKIYEKYI